MPSTCFIFFSSFIIIINSVVNFSAKFTCLEVSTPYKKKRTKKKKLVLILQSVLCWKYTRIKQKQIKELRVRKHIKMEISEFCLCRYPPWHCRIQKVFFAYLWIPALIFTTVLSHEQTALQELLNYPTTKNCEKMDSSISVPALCSQQLPFWIVCLLHLK